MPRRAARKDLVLNELAVSNVRTSTLPCLSKLSKLDQTFVFEYLKDFNILRALTRASYFGNREPSEHGARLAGIQLLSRPEIQDALREVTKSVALSPSMIEHELTKIGTSSITDVVSWSEDVDGNTVMRLRSPQAIGQMASAIKRIKVGKNGEIDVTLHDKISALDRLARVAGMYEDTVKVEAGGGLLEILTEATRINSAKVINGEAEAID